MRFVLVGGGTAGHIFPTIAVADRLVELAGPSASLTAVCGVRKLDRLLYKNVKLEVFPIPARGIIDIAIWRIPWHMWLMLRSFVLVWRDFAQHKPSVVVASGGYVSVPVLLVCWLRRIPSIIFSGDAALGWATRLMAPLTTKATIAFDEARDQISGTPTQLTGYPIRPAFASPDPDAGRLLGNVRGHRPFVLVMGGSQGAHAINEALKLDLELLLARVHVVHISGRNDYDGLETVRVQLPDDQRHAYELHEFVSDGFANLLAAADIVISRAGATSVAELSAVGAASILIPGTFGKGHQVATATAIATAGAATMLLESQLVPGKLTKTLFDLLDHPEKLNHMRQASRARGKPDAADVLATLSLELAIPPTRTS
jgi:UDP-N-acetylglucosamine--N-acetylmuramyl-(pentapeptide) pyrophosphoryl-undecaprenol N-acetylglucosamine transferase